jgi:anti-sigma B factor antagonist
MQTNNVQEMVLICPEGKITAANADSFRQKLLELVQGGAKHITIDLQKIDMIDSKGLAVFIVCHKTLSGQGGRLTVITQNDDFRQLFHVMRLDEHMEIKTSV